MIAFTALDLAYLIQVYFSFIIIKITLTIQTHKCFDACWPVLGLQKYFTKPIIYNIFIHGLLNHSRQNISLTKKILRKY